MTVARRTEVLRAAADLFAEHGFHGVGMRAIGDAAGMRGASLYHYFPSKIDILHAVTVELTRAFIDSQLADLSPCPTYTSRVRSLAVRHVLYLHENRTAQAVGLREMQVLALHRPTAHKELIDMAHRYRAALEQLIVDGIGAGEFSCDNTTLTTLAVVGMLSSVNEWYAPDRDGPITDLASAYATMVVARMLRSSVEPDGPGRP